MKTPQYNTILFTEIYSNVEDFLNDYHDVGIPAKVKDESATTIFYLLYGRYGNSPIANSDVEQFKYKLFSTMFQYGPAWVREVDIQDKLLALSDEELLIGSKTIYNHAYNNNTEPSTQALNELKYINEQSTQNVKRSKLDAYSMLLDLIHTDMTEAFLNRFKTLFKAFVEPEDPLLFYTEVDE